MSTHEFVSTIRHRFDLKVGMSHAQGRVLEISRDYGHLALSLVDRGFEVSIGMPDDIYALDGRSDKRDVGPERLSNTVDFWSQGGFDTILQLQPFAPFGQGEEACLRLAELLRPGGKAILRCGQLDWERLEHLDHQLRERECTIIHAQAVDILDHWWIRARLAEDYPAAFEELVRVFKVPGAIELWEFIERQVVPLLSFSSLSPGFVIIERATPDHAPPAWSTQPRLEPHSSRIDAEVLRELLKEDFEAFQETFGKLTRTPGGVRLLVTLDQWLGRHLPARVDFLSLLDSDNRARILDLVAWRWTQGWNQHLPGCLSVAPLVEYEVFQSLVRVLKPLKETT